MKQRRAHHVVPAVIMAGAAAVPLATTVEILSHATSGGRPTALQPSAPVAANPPSSSSGTAASSSPATSGGSGTYQGPVVNQPFGGVQASVTLAGQKITNVVITAPQDNPRSAYINQQAVPLLQSETLQAQSAQINTISGATLTSQAYIQSLQAALSQARGQGSSSTGSSSSAAGSGQGSSISISGGGDD
jgi:uncharacterized protein with FMN-binding domain